MSPLVITLLIVGGIAILIAIAYINHMVENNRLEKARLKADLTDRLRRSTDLSETLPGQLMTPALKLLLSRLQLHYSERLLAVDKASVNPTLLQELRALVAQDQSIAVRNAPQPILTEVKAKEVRFQLENLHALITRCVQDGLLSPHEGKHWLNETRHMLTQLHIEFFSNLGQQALKQGQPGQARLAFERGVQYLRKQPDPSRYKTALADFERLLAQANAMVLSQEKPAVEEPSELTKGLDSLEEDMGWKKKNIYD